MDPALAVVVSLQVATIGWLLYHSSQCAAFHERVAKLEAENFRLRQDIGDHDSGLRGSVHDLREMMSGPYLKMQMELERLEKGK